MANQEPAAITNRNERVLSGFASLLSSVVTTSGEAPEALSTSSVNLPRFVASTVPEDNDCCTVPCLMLKHSGSSSTPSASLEETAALCLARPLTVTRSELEALPQTLLENISETFMSLVDSRLRSSLSAILVQSDSQNESAITRISCWASSGTLRYWKQWQSDLSNSCGHFVSNPTRVRPNTEWRSCCSLGNGNSH